jgi:hypothetical protein
LGAFSVVGETDTQGGWSFSVVFEDAKGQRLEKEARLSWVDCDLWGGGAQAPVDVCKAVLAVVLSEVEAQSLKPRFDLASLRALVSDLDRRVREDL